jgi:hypothetical protein
MAAVYVSNIVINAGTDFSQTFVLDDFSTNSALNLTGYGVSCQMRKWAGSATSYSFQTSIPNPTQGTIQIGLSTSITSSIRPGRYIYDIVVTTPTNTKTRVVEGMALVREGVTK